MKSLKKIFKIFAIAILFIYFVPNVNAQYYYQSCPNGQCANMTYQYQPTYYNTTYRQPTTYYQYPTYYQTAVQPVSYVQNTQYVQSTQYTTQNNSDPNGFINWLNTIRAQYGLCLVAYDSNLEAWANQNNIHQASRGLGHFVMGTARRQNAGVGNYAQILPAWLNSPGHRAALLDPTIRFIGIAGLGAYWTFNAY